MIKSDFSEGKPYVKNNSYVITWKVVLIANIMSAVALFALVKLAVLIDSQQWIPYLFITIAFAYFGMRYIKRVLEK